MPNLYFASTPKTPEIACRNDGFISLKGRSLPEDTASFYAPVIEWLSDYYRDPQPETLVHIDLEYLNSSSASMLHKMCFALERLVKFRNRIVHVSFYLEPDDRDMFELCENLTFYFPALNITPIKKDEALKKGA